MTIHSRTPSRLRDTNPAFGMTESIHHQESYKQMLNKSLLAVLITSVSILTLACDSEDFDTYIDEVEDQSFEGEFGEVAVEGDLQLEGDEDESMFADELDSSTDTTPVISGGHKICSIVVPFSWRDTIVVPDSWSANDCDDFRASMGASHAQLGCLTAGSYTLGLTSTGVPPAAPGTNPCGW